MGEEGGLHYCLGCNGSGVAMMTYLGTQTARKIARVANAPCAFDAPDFPTIRSIPAIRGSCRWSAAGTGCATGSIACSREAGGRRYCHDRSRREDRHAVRRVQILARRRVAAGRHQRAVAGAVVAGQGRLAQGASLRQDAHDEDGAWAHAYLHRVEGDAANAGGWYRRAGKTPSTAPLDTEWDEIAKALLAA